MKIERKTLIENLTAFANNGSGTVIGQPGVGKSYALLELRRNLKANDIAHLILSVEQLGQGSDVEIKAVLKRDGDFIHLLKNAAGNLTRPAILIFDGFDAARGEDERAGIYRLILRAVNELRGVWNVIVSVRTFDAKKSERLLSLFPKVDGFTESSTIPCRNFLIPPFCEDELNQAFTQLPGLKKLYLNGTNELRGILTIPFNLWLIERIAEHGLNIAELSHIVSEVQLLSIYWDYRVRNATLPEDREYILTRITTKMVEGHTLMVPRNSIYEPTSSVAWSGLLSDEIICEVPNPQISVAFKHNILFDFAVSAHLLNNNPKAFSEFVVADSARPLFLRPSLVYHFTRLWHFDREIFWDNFWAVLNRSETHLRQIVRLVLPTIVINEAKDIKDLMPILDKLALNDTIAIEAVKFLLQALRILDFNRVDLWMKFIQSCVQRPNPQFAFDAGFIPFSIIESKRPTSGEFTKSAGTIGIKLLSWAIETAKSDIAEKRYWYYRLIGSVAVPLVARTYEVHAQDARELLQAVVSMVDEPSFPIDCIFSLCHQVKLLAASDVELLDEIYEKVYAHNESSAEKTNFGGPVVAMISNRRQDYDMCKYTLSKEYPEILAKCGLPLIAAGIHAISAYIYSKHIYRYEEDLVKLTFNFQFRGIQACYIEDKSAIWDESSFPDSEMQVGDAIFRWISDAAKRDESEKIDSFLNLFGKEAQLAFLWARLLLVGAEHPIAIGRKIWHLAIAIPVLEGMDTIYALGVYLEKSFKHLDIDQKQQIEYAILNLPNAIQNARPGFSEQRRRRLMARIELADLSSDDARNLRRELGQSADFPLNSRPFSISSGFVRQTEDEILTREGIDTKSPLTKEVRGLFEPLKRWLEQKREKCAFQQLMPAAKILHETLRKHENSDEEIIDVGWIHLSSFAAAIGSIMEVDDRENFIQIRDIILDAASRPKPLAGPNIDDDWNSACWSPEPRTEAAQCLPRLASLILDSQILDTIIRLSKDTVPCVRFLLACELWRLRECAPTVMWELLNRFTDDRNQIVLQGVTSTLWNTISQNKNASLDVIKKLLARVEKLGKLKDREWDGLFSMIVDYAIHFEDTWANETICSWRSEPLAYSTEISICGQRFVEYMTPNAKPIHFERAQKQLIQLFGAIPTGIEQLRKVEAQMDLEDARDAYRKFYGIIDNAVTRIYFSADIDVNLRRTKQPSLDDLTRSAYFRDVLPTLNAVLQFSGQENSGLQATTAHYYMQLLNGVLKYDPKLVLQLATDVVNGSKRFNYNLDSLALREVVSLVEAILTDWREKIQDEASVKNLINLLDVFVDVGWPDALKLVWRLDEIYR